MPPMFRLIPLMLVCAAGCASAPQDPARVVEVYKQMSFLRVFDGKAVNLQRTGKLGTYASCLGHEAAHVSIGTAMHEDDCFAPMYREYGAQFARGVKPREVLMYWGGDERGNDFTGPLSVAVTGANDSKFFRYDR